MINLKKIFITVILFFSAIGITFAQEESDYSKIYTLYNQCMQLEEENFKNLGFQVAEDQNLVTKSEINIIFEDNLSRKWVFYPLSSEDEYQRVYLAYRLYTFLGVDTAQVHPFSFIINDKQQVGYIVKYETSKYTVEDFFPKKISQEGIDYIVKSHVLDWLINNYNVSGKNYLVLSSDAAEKANRILRINNQEAFLKKDMVEISPGFNAIVMQFYGKDKKDNFLYNFWRDYTEKVFNIDLRKAYAYVKFVSNVPQDYLNKLGLIFSENDFKQRKEVLDNFFLRFYNYVGVFNDVNISFMDDISTDMVTEDIMLFLEAKKQQLIHESKQLAGKQVTEEINYEMKDSIEGHEILKKVYQEYSFNRMKLYDKCSDYLNDLMSLQAKAKNDLEKNALEKYIAEVGKICSGQKPSFNSKQLNKVMSVDLPKKDIKNKKKLLEIPPIP